MEEKGRKGRRTKVGRALRVNSLRTGAVGLWSRSRLVCIMHWCHVCYRSPCVLLARCVNQWWWIVWSHRVFRRQSASVYQVSTVGCLRARAIRRYSVTYHLCFGAHEVLPMFPPHGANIRHCPAVGQCLMFAPWGGNIGRTPTSVHPSVYRVYR